MALPWTRRGHAFFGDGMFFADGDGGCWVALSAAFVLIAGLAGVIAKMGADVASLKAADRNRKSERPHNWNGEP